MRAVAVALLVAVLAAGCGGSAEGRLDSYCDALRDEKSAFLDLAADAKAQKDGYLTDALALFRRMQEDAPDGLRDEWDTVVLAWADLVDVLEETGVDPEGFDPSTRPPGLTDEQFATVKGVADELSSARVQDATREITEQAEQVCKVDLAP